MEEELTKHQIQALSELRLLLKNEIPSPVYEDTQRLVKFLIAREYNVKKAESMLRKNLRWQKEMQLENLLEDYSPPEVLKKYFITSFLGYDKDGDPVEYYDTTNVDEKGILKSVNDFQLRKLIAKIQETNLRRKKPDGSGNCSKVLYINNVANVPFYRFLNKRIISVVLKLVMEFQDNFPEIVKNVILINASPAFAAIWSIVKEWLGSSLLQKILIYNEGDAWKEELLKRVDADVLPAFLGGNKTDPDGNPECLTTVSHGGIVPEKYFAEINSEEFLQNPGATTARIGRQKQLLVPFQVTNPDCILNWEFIVLHSYDIGFGLSLKTTDDTFEELIPVHKIETERLPERGMYRCKATGTHYIIFDNSYSWIHYKEICYRLWTTSVN